MFLAHKVDTYSAGFLGRDEVSLEVQTQGDEILKSTLKGIGCPNFLKNLAKQRKLLTGKISQIALPQGNTHVDIIFRELILKLQGKWDYPYKEEELCHCRLVPCSVVDQSIVFGANSSEKVAQLTLAGTGCGTCRKNIDKIISFRYS